MIENAPSLCPELMFQGKYLVRADYFQMYAPMFRCVVADWGREKVDKYYDWLFVQLNRMSWGQWFSVSKFAPELRMRPLFYWAMETIYQSDPWSQFEFRTVDGDERVYVVEPTPVIKQRCDFALGRGKYNLYNLYGELRTAPPTFCPEISRAWLMLATAEPESSDSTDEEAASATIDYSDSSDDTD